MGIHGTVTDTDTGPTVAGDDGEQQRRRSRSVRWLLGLAAVTVLLAVAIPLAPVRGERVDVSWPRAGQPTESTVAMFMPYRPLELDVALSCSALPRAPGGGQVTSFSTFPPNSSVGHRRGMSLQVRNQRLSLRAGGREFPAGRVPGGDCTYRVHAANDQLVLSVDGRAGRSEIVRVSTPVPQVNAFVTELPSRLATGRLSAHAEADARFSTTPTPLKLVLMIGCGLGALACVVVGFVVFGRSDRPKEGRRTAGRWKRLGWHVVVAIGLCGWAIIGALTTDDGWLTAMDRNVDSAGFTGNYYMVLNAAETPAVLLQHLFALVVNISASPLVMRLPAVLAGFAMWLLLRGVVRLLERHTSAVRIPHWLLAAAFFVAYVPTSLGTRLDPFVAVCTAVSAYAALRARLEPNPAWLVVGGLATGVSFVVTSTGLLAAIPVVLGLVYSLRTIDGTSRRIALVAITLGAAAVAAPLAFGDSGLGGFLDTVATRYWYGASRSWYDEFLRYQVLLGGGAGPDYLHFHHPFRRLPVLLGIGLLVVATAMRLRDGRDSTFSGVFGWPFAWFGLSLAGLVFTPTKAISQFTALEFFTALVIALGLAGMPRAFAVGRAGGVVRFATLGMMVLLLSITWNGTNSWWTYSRLGMPFLDQRFFGGLLANPLVLLAIGAAVAAVLMVVERRRRNGTPDEAVPVVRFAGWAAIGMATVSVLLVPLLAAAVFTKAALDQHQRGSWSMASGNLRTITGSSCGIADAVRVRIGGTQRSLTEVTAPAAGPVLADWPISFALPCLRLPALADGMVAPPRLLLTAPKPFTDDGALDRHYRPFGGAFAGVGAVADYRKIPTRLVGSGDPKAWGSLFAVDYQYRTDGFEVRRTLVERAGWWRGPTYASEEYIGQPPPQ